MSELAELQYWVAGLLRHKRALPKDAAIAAQAREHVTGNKYLSPAEQVDVYREQFWIRHTSCLVEDFPGLGGVLGQEDWEKLIEGYLEKTAPTSWTLRDLGDRLPQYVENEATWLPHHDLCVDMARLEWLYTEIFDAPDAVPLDAKKLEAIPEAAWQKALVELNPALRLLRVNYPVAELRVELRTRALQQEQELEPVPIPKPEAQNLVLYRGKNLDLFYRTEDDSAFAVLEALEQGVPLVPACERALERGKEDAETLAAKVGQWFQTWGTRGWIVDVKAD